MSNQETILNKVKIWIVGPLLVILGWFVTDTLSSIREELRSLRSDVRVLLADKARLDALEKRTDNLEKKVLFGQTSLPSNPEQPRKPVFMEVVALRVDDQYKLIRKQPEKRTLI